ncbi:MAG: exo-beta-N-acetylmuramidase NamZ domain-containing protein [Planctomycetota bacterium]|nr:exo-beta-N-acetylmuramidase NamZ domain-containing protein [Planctomycetota bacterium]
MKCRALLRLLCLFSVSCLCRWVAADTPPPLPHVAPADAGMDGRRLAVIDQVVATGIRRQRMPGCVVLVGRAGKIVLLKAYGNRQLEPTVAPMTTDTVFDLASLTKPIATATSVMRLVEEGRVQLADPVSKHLPEFGQQGKDVITIKQLLTHQGGLIPDNALRDYDQGPTEAFRRIDELKTYVEPGTKFIYTDVGYIVLAKLVHELTGKRIDEYAQQTIFQPLGMQETGYLPGAELQQRAAPTEQREGRWMRGEVHDPRAYRLGGVAGHAGLFSTAEDLARYAQMLLNQGSYQGVTVLQPQTVALMSRPVSVSSGWRGLGWDIRTGYSSNRGDLFTPRAFGHGGFTGTTFWVDPGHDLFVIFLSNRLHPSGKGSVNALAGRIGTLAAAAIKDTGPIPAVPGAAVLTGIDVLQLHGFEQLRGRNVGLITNHTGINRHGVSTVKLLHEAKDVSLVALFSPEHGFAGKLDVAKVADANDAETGLKIFSLYGASRAPTAESLQGIDTLVFDIQDIGTRFYTYISTMGLAMRAAAEHDVRFVVLDRPNPTGGQHAQGPVLDAGSESFVGFHRIAVRHGMTTGELARMFKDEFGLELELRVIKVTGWRRHDLFDATGLLWVNPSPNMRSLTQALLYPGIGLLETTNLSVGRGTDTPFEVVGAPWIDGAVLAEALHREHLSGVRFIPIRFTPRASVFKGEMCGGINIVITERATFHPLTMGLTLATTLRRLYPDDWETKRLNRLLASVKTRDAIVRAAPVSVIRNNYRAELDQFKIRREKFLLYE